MKNRGKIRQPSAPRLIGGWVKAADRFVEAIPSVRLHPAVLAWARERTRASRGSWGVAFSGGSDSLALLLLVRALRPAAKGKLVALHFNHRLRGSSSDRDEAFCRKTCAALGVTLRVGRWSKAPGKASEAEARAARFCFLDQSLREMRSKALWLGHQQDDIAETLLMRVARGSGTGGLAAPRPVHAMSHGRIHLRPLLTLKKAELMRALSDAGIPWREDDSNSSGQFLRNRVRQKVIPAWQEASGERDVLAGAALAREMIEEDDRALEAWLDQIVPEGIGAALDLKTFAGKPRALLRRAVHRWFLAEPRASALSSKGFNDLLDAAAVGASTQRSVGRAGFAVIRKGVLNYQPSRTALKDGK